MYWLNLHKSNKNNTTNNYWQNNSNNYNIENVTYDDVGTDCHNENSKDKSNDNGESNYDGNVSVNDSYHDDSENESDNDDVSSRSMSVSEQRRTYPSPNPTLT